jgi:ankyrin repeat protein
MRCKKISRTWYDFIQEQKFTSIRIIKKYVKESNHTYTECPKHWQQLFKLSNTKQVANLASEIQKHRKTNTRLGLISLSHIGKGLTPLHLATMFSQIINLETIKNICEMETVKNPKDIEGNTPLHLAARKGNFEVFLLIKEKVEDINPKNAHGNTPLHRAALSDRTCGKKIVELIIKNIVEKNPVNVVGITPLHNAAISGRLDIFKIIFENVTNQNPIDTYGETPLHKAADGTGGGLYKYCQFYPMNKRCQHTKICQLILDNNGNKNPVNFDGKTPLEMAVKSNHSLVVNVLTNN